MSCVRIFGVWLLVLGGLVSAGTTIYVDGSVGNDGWPGTWTQPKRSIGAAISAAVDTDVVAVRAGTYTGANNRNLQPGSKDIVIRSESGPTMTIIDAQGLGRVFRVQLAPSTAAIKGFTIQNGFSDTLMTSGGGGGGIYLSQTAITIEDCIIKNCVAIEGAGLLIRNSTGTRVVNCRIQNNTGTHEYITCRAAGVYLYLSSDVEFQGCRFISNRVEPTSNSGNGGAMYLYRYDATFERCLFEGNYAKNSGGVAFVEDGALTFANCTFFGNASGGNGGCFWVGYMGANHEAACRNSIFRSNSAGGSGHVAYLASVGTVGGIFRYGYCDINPSHLSHGSPGGWVIQNLGGNINVDPLFASPGYWDNNIQQWIPGDYHLKSMVGRLNPITGGWNVDPVHSPCIDAGDLAESYSSEPTPNGERLNLGMYGNTSQASKSEYCSTPIPADLSGDCRVDFEDFAMFAEVWLTCNIVPAEFCW